jgi:protease-4
MIIARWIGFILDLFLLPLRLASRIWAARPGTWLHVRVDGPVVDVVGRSRFWDVRAQKALSLHWLSEVVTAMIRDSRIKGMLVTLRSMGGGMATATSLRAILARARAAGKEVAVYLPMGGGTKEVYVATAATKVLIGPATQLAPLGFRVASRYVKRALDRAGIEPQVFACGEFKSAGETLVRDSMSPEQRAQLERLMDTFHASLVDAIAEGRELGRERAAAVVDEAPYFGRAAIDAGLADDVAYEDEVPSKLGLSRDERKPSLLVNAATYHARMKRPLLRSILRPPVVAVVPVHGAITHAGGIFSDLSTDERVARMVRAARRDRAVKAVILHVDSPGGSALASDLIHHEIAQLAREKPVVACMANVAASGGYYVAAPAACIVAEPTTVTGSIGVVAARLSLDPLLTRLGISTQVIERGARASLLSPLGPLSDADRAAIERELEATYRAFVGVVAAGRRMSEEQVEKLARGRVYTGKDAHEAGLVDVLGGFEAAVEQVERWLDERTRRRAVIAVARPPRQRLAAPAPPKGGEAGRKAAQAIADLLFPARDRVLFELLASGEHLLALAPISET